MLLENWFLENSRELPWMKFSRMNSPFSRNGFFKNISYFAILNTFSQKSFFNTTTYYIFFEKFCQLMKRYVLKMHYKYIAYSFILSLNLSLPRSWSTILTMIEYLNHLDHDRLCQQSWTSRLLSTMKNKKANLFIFENFTVCMNMVSLEANHS